MDNKKIRGLIFDAHIAGQRLNSNADANWKMAGIYVDKIIDTIEHEKMDISSINVPPIINSFCHHKGTYTTIKDLNGNEICCKCKKPLEK